MEKILNDFINKNISPLELIKKLNKYKKYVCYDKYKEQKYKELIEDIKYIMNSETEKNQYENISVLLYRYLNNRRTFK